MTPDTFALLAAFLCFLVVVRQVWRLSSPARSTERPQRGPWAGSGASSGIGQPWDHEAVPGAALAALSDLALSRLAAREAQREPDWSGWHEWRQRVNGEDHDPNE